jgi:hypothetical protein
MLATVRARAENDAPKETTEATTTTEAIVTLSTVAKEAAASKKKGSCTTKTTKPHHSEKNREDLLRGARVIDANATARFSLAVFVEYVFGRKWESAFEVLVDASWEWRREIAVRGRADISVKRDAVRLVVGDLLRNNEKLWAMHGEAWWEPRNYSLVMQPFLISPAINVGDVAVALKRRPGSRLEDAMRDAHPFPIFERFVEEDVYVDRRAGRGATSGRNANALKPRRLAVKKNTFAGRTCLGRCSARGRGCARARRQHSACCASWRPRSPPPEKRLRRRRGTSTAAGTTTASPG